MIHGVSLNPFPFWPNFLELVILVLLDFFFICLPCFYIDNIN